MPSVEQILQGLTNITIIFQWVAVLWHFYFAVFCIALISGARPPQKITAILISVPMLSVGITAWLMFNPFNGIVFTLAGIILLYISFKLPAGEIKIATTPVAAAGILVIIFGWIYPHFIESGSILQYLYKAPTGLIPCATLSIVTGFAILFRNFNSRLFAITLSVLGIFYGLTGVLQLKVLIDLILLASALLLLILSLRKPQTENLQKNSKQMKMTEFGVGPRIVLILIFYIALALIAQNNDPEKMLMSPDFHPGFAVAGIILILIGIVLWGPGALKITKAFKEGKLLTTGVYSIVRNPMYSGFIVFIIPGIAVWLRSWPLLTASLAAAVSFCYLIKKEEDYLEQKYGSEYLEYRKKVNSLIPFI